MRFGAIRCVHGHYRLTEREANSYLSSLVLICIESIELLELFVNMRWH